MSETEIPASIFGGSKDAGRFFIGLRKLYAASCGRAVDPEEFGQALGSHLRREPFTAAEIHAFDRGRYLSHSILYGCIGLISSLGPG